MGLPSANKRKLSGGGAGGEEDGPLSPAKQCRSEDQTWIADVPGQNVNPLKPSRPSRLEELASVAPPDWAAQRPALLTTLLEDDDEFDDEDFDDEEEDERMDGKYLPAGRTYSCRYSAEDPCFNNKNSCYEDQGYSGGSSPVHYGARSAYSSSRSPQYWGYPSSPPQQTIRCEENGKSYLELGPSPASARSRTPSAGLDKCCDAERTSWCRRAPETSCYRQRRLAVFNLSMCKLGRYRQFTDPSLLRSVLICNTLRYIEREMEQEGCFYGGLSGHAATCSPPPPLPPTPSPPEVDPTFPPPQFLEVPDITPAASSYRAGPEFYEQSGRATPFPMLGSGCDTDSGMGDDDNARSINWGSVLSLSSQSDLDPMNNNELYSDSSATQDLVHEFDDFLPSWKLTPVSAEEVLKSASSEPVPSLSPCQIQGQDMELMQVLVSS
ncbi:hypothetical protein RUM44_000428 [Polyplax serrata]|uniref:SERTA domain-containing protein n=1 Tax=Polyplax serrata TaxID=468196 RepID=A0ABR1B6L3_POLSC